ncbi:hypothetical protein GCM10023078_24560 [Gibbsiella greigii]
MWGIGQCRLVIVCGQFPHPGPLPKGEGAYDEAWVWGIGQCRLVIVCGQFPHPAPLPKGEGRTMRHGCGGLGSAGWNCVRPVPSPRPSPWGRGGVLCGMGVGDWQCWLELCAASSLTPALSPRERGRTMWHRGSAGGQLSTDCSLSLGERVRVRGD